MIQLTDLIVKVAQEADDALLRLARAVEMSGQLNELGDHLIGHFVDQARRSGASWTEIGASMGVTKQAAQQRFVPKAPATLDPAEGFQPHHGTGNWFRPRRRGSGNLGI